MVAWYGGSGWSFSASFGAPVFGWVPLGWGEPYMPWWRGCSDRCWTMYNRPYAVNYAERPHAPPTRYRNWSAPGGVTAVAGATFTGRQPVHRNLVDVKPQLVSGAPMLAQAPGVAKPTAATIPGAKPATTAVPPPASHFYRTKPMQASPGGGSAVPPGQAGRPGTTWGGATSAPAAIAKPGAPSGATGAPPGQAVRPGSTWVDGGRTSTGAQPAAAKPGSHSSVPATRPAPSAGSPTPSAGRSPQAGAYSQGTWGAPSAPAPRYEPRTVAPASSASSPRAAPPSQGATRSSSAPPASAGAPRPTQATPPPASVAPPARAAPPAAPAAPAPRSGSGGSSGADKPAPHGKGQKPGEGQ
jgi:hypothetical protein